MEETPKEEKDLTAILSYIGILFLIPLLACKDNAFDQFHAKQGLVLFIIAIINCIISMIPFIGWVVGFVIWIIILVLAIIGIVNVVQGEKKPLPIIGGYAEKFKF